MAVELVLHPGFAPDADCNPNLKEVSFLAGRDCIRVLRRMRIVTMGACRL